MKKNKTVGHIRILGREEQISRDSRVMILGGSDESLTDLVARLMGCQGEEGEDSAEQTSKLIGTWNGPRLFF